MSKPHEHGSGLTVAKKLPKNLKKTQKKTKSIRNKAKNFTKTEFFSQYDLNKTFFRPDDSPKNL